MSEQRTTCGLVLAESYPILLEGMRRTFGSDPDFRVLACCRTGDEALRAVLEHRPDVLVLDLRIAREAAFEVLRDLRARRSPCRVVLLADWVSEVEIAEATRLGAMGVVLNRVSSVTVADAVPPIAALAGEGAFVHVGGPVQPQAVVVLADFVEPNRAGALVLETIGFLPGEVDDETELGELRNARVFAGYAGWGPGQLEEELDEAERELHAIDSKILVEAEWLEKQLAEPSAWPTMPPKERARLFRGLLKEIVVGSQGERVELHLQDWIVRSQRSEKKRGES